MFAPRMEAIVVRALTKIATDCPRRQSILKKQCREALGERERESGFVLFSRRVVCACCSFRTDVRSACVQDCTDWCSLFLSGACVCGATLVGY